MSFRTLLDEALSLHGAAVRGLVFCDDQGERIDAAHRDDVDPFELDMVGAAYAALAARLDDGAVARVRHAHNGVCVAGVSAGTYLVAITTPCGSAELSQLILGMPRLVAGLRERM